MSIKKKFLLAGIFLLLLGISLSCCHAALRHLEQRERQHCYGIAQSQLGYLTRQVENIFNTTRLLADVRALPNARILENTCMTDLIEGFDREGRRVCRGVVATGEKNERLEIRADATVLATGGVGGLYEHSTNFGCLTGDGCRVAAEHGVLLEHMDYVQIHPTTLWTERPGRSFLISESARGEGAVLLNDAGERFVDELQPRDVVSAAILAEMARTGAAHVWLSFARVPREEIEGHFTHILERCLEEGYDIREEPIPVVPAQHYFMGGIHVDSDSQTTLPHLFACGETCCNGVHGRNRLASNSLLESLVFAQRAADKIMRDRFADDTAAQLAAAARARSRFIAGSRDVTDVALLTGAE